MAKNDLIEEIVKIVLTNLRKEKGRLTQIRGDAAHSF